MLTDRKEYRKCDEKSLLTALMLLMPLTAAMAAPDDGDEFQISCQGRQTMTIDRAEYGISTLMWGGDNFQIAAGQQRTRLSDGQPVSITLFRNGDQLMIDQATQNTFLYMPVPRHWCPAKEPLPGLIL